MRLITFLLLCGLFSAVGGVAARAIYLARQAAIQSSCTGHFCAVWLATMNYQDIHRSLPPAYVDGPDGTRWHSWRALLLPYLQDSTPSSYRFDEPWDGPHNRNFANDQYATYFRCINEPDSTETDIVVVVGPRTAFPGATARSLTTVRNLGADNIMLCEIANSGINLMEPRDLKYDTMSFQINDPTKPSISSPHPDGAIVVFGKDRINTRRLGRDTNIDQLKREILVQP